MRGVSRRLLRNVSLAALFLGGTSVLYLAIDGPPAQRLSVATAYVGLLLLAATLLVGPLSDRSGRATPVSTNLRRDIGIWAAIGGLMHTVVGLQVHMRGQVVRYFVPDTEMGALSKGAIAFLSANYTGLAATLLLVLLLAISNDLALRSLGTARWKRIQRLNYLLFALVVVHGALYLAVDRATWRLILPFVLIVAVACQIQLQGRRSRASGIRQ
ncbi:MAG TPA: ferric reductase-like transmembrane domain-containing protein [Gemmatimonadaceae bacterium]|nr:ferric reductase-like transmembrane domain-containing protein [Gemmatimonadaceae bacterium]